MRIIISPPQPVYTKPLASIDNENSSATSKYRWDKKRCPGNEKEGSTPHSESNSHKKEPNEREFLYPGSERPSEDHGTKDVERESPSDSTSSAFASGKSFWMKFLHESQSPASQESGKRDTPIGREIQNTWSSGSPLSECSAFCEIEDPSPKSVASTSDRIAEYPSKNQVGRQGVLKEVSRNDENSVSGHRRASNGSRPSPLLIPRRGINTPESGKQGIMTPRYFGDVTNRIDHCTPSPVTNSNTKPKSRVAELAETFKKESNSERSDPRSFSQSSRVAEYMEISEKGPNSRKSCTPSPSQFSRVAELAQFLEREQINISPSQIIPSSSNEEATKKSEVVDSSRNAHNYPLKVMTSSTPIPNNSNHRILESPKPDPLIEMGGSLQTPVSLSSIASGGSRQSTTSQMYKLKKFKYASDDTEEDKSMQCNLPKAESWSPYTDGIDSSKSIQYGLPKAKSWSPVTNGTKDTTLMQHSVPETKVMPSVGQNEDKVHQSSDEHKTALTSGDVPLPTRTELRSTETSPIISENLCDQIYELPQTDSNDSPTPPGTYSIDLEDTKGPRFKHATNQWPPPMRTSYPSVSQPESKGTPNATDLGVIEDSPKAADAKAETLRTPLPEATDDLPTLSETVYAPEESISKIKQVFRQRSPPIQPLITDHPLRSPVESLESLKSVESATDNTVTLLDDAVTGKILHTSNSNASLPESDLKCVAVEKSFGFVQPPKPLESQFQLSSENRVSTNGSTTSDKKTPSQDKKDDRPAQPKDVSKSSESKKEFGFEKLLEKWRDQSDDKPTSHFLSPEQESRSTEVVNGQRNTEELASNPSQDQLAYGSKPETPLVQKRIETYDKDYFDITREKLDSISQSTEISYHPTEILEKMKSTIPRLQNAESCAKDVENQVYCDNGVIVCQPVSGDNNDVNEVTDDREMSQAIVILKKNEHIQVLVGKSKDDASEAVVVRNLELVASSEQESIEANNSPCECSRSIFSGNDDLISFFLPLMGKACTCGQHSGGLLIPDDPTALENILRPWQVEFLKSFGIHQGDQLVKARHRSASVLAKGLRQWRRKKGMIPFKTSACGMAIHIWAKTCKAFVRSIRKKEQPYGLAQEFSNFLGDLPAAPERREEGIMIAIEPDSQVEV